MSSIHEPEQLVGLQDRLVARAAPLYKQEEVMTNVKEHFVWIDVSKDRLDVAVWGEKRPREAANTN